MIGLTQNTDNNISDVNLDLQRWMLILLVNDVQKNKKMATQSVDFRSSSLDYGRRGDYFLQIVTSSVIHTNESAHGTFHMFFVCTNEPRH